MPMEKAQSRGMGTGEPDCERCQLQPEVLAMIRAEVNRALPRNRQIMPGELAPGALSSSSQALLWTHLSDAHQTPIAP
jgi:hypothetical protein